MAGHRRLLPRTGDGALHPMAATGRPERIRERFLARYADAQTQPARVAAAKDYLLAAVRPAARTDPERVRQVLAHVERELMRAAETLLESASKRRAS